VKRAVIFDLGNTLVSYYTRDQWPDILAAGISQVAEGLRARGLLRVAPQELPARVAAERGSGTDHRVRPLAGRLARVFGLTVEEMADELAEDLCRRFMRPIFATARRYDDVLPVLAELRRRGLRLGILSNTPWGSPAGLWREEIARHDLTRAVDEAVFCEDVGWRKPDPRAFEFVLDKLGAAAGEGLFVGDDPRWDLAGPAGVGMDAVLIDRHGTAGDTGAIQGLTQLLDRLGQHG